MISHWYYDDPVLYSESNLRTILESYRWKTERLTPKYFWQIVRGPMRDRAVWAVALVLPFFLISVYSRQWKGAVIASAIVCLALISVLIVNDKLVPRRVYFPLVSFPLSVSLAMSFCEVRRRDEADAERPFDWRGSWMALSFGTRTAIILLVAGMVFGLYAQCQRSVRIHRDRAIFDSFLADISRNGRTLYVCWEASIPYELVSPFDTMQSWSRMPLIEIGWTQRTPWHDAMKRKFGITDLAQAICHQRDLILVTWRDYDVLFSTFVKEHYGLDVDFVQLAAADKKQYVAGRFEVRPPALESITGRPNVLRK